ncbi:hypothetical protein [Rubritalea tangerina]
MCGGHWLGGCWNLVGELKIYKKRLVNRSFELLMCTIVFGVHGAEAGSIL